MKTRIRIQIIGGRGEELRERREEERKGEGRRRKEGRG